MDTLLLNIFAFLRPILFIHTGIGVAGLSLFELAAIFLGFILLFMLFYKATLTGQVYFSSIDIVILLFSFWCVAIFIAYVDDAAVDKVATYILPLLTFIVVKNIIHEKRQFRQLLLVLIAGFAIPVAASAVLIALGGGVGKISYWTGLSRYEGVYLGAHNMSHNMAFMIMIIVTYITLSHFDREEGERGVGIGKKLFMGLLTLMAIYCLYKGWVRTAIAGLLIFMTIYLFYFNKKILVMSMAGIVALSILLAPIFVPRFLGGVREGETSLSFNQITSGRLEIWTANMAGFIELPIDQKLAGKGIGNEYDLAGRPHDTHNDLLGLLADTGIVGFMLYMFLQFLILRRILDMEDGEKQVFLALFISIFLMNFGSNSYISRFGLAQYFFLVMAYVDLPSVIRPVVSESIDQRIPVIQTRNDQPWRHTA